MTRVLLGSGPANDSQSSAPEKTGFSACSEQRRPMPPALPVLAAEAVDARLREWTSSGIGVGGVAGDVGLADVAEGREVDPGGDVEALLVAVVGRRPE